MEHHKVDPKDRDNELKELIAESERYSERLNALELGLHKKIIQYRRKRLFQLSSSLCAVFAVIILLVNTNVAMAEALCHIPVVGELFELVRFDKGLKNAIQNDYATKVDLYDTDGGYTLGIPYVISDTNRLVLFFSVPNSIYEEEGDYANIYVTKIVNADTMETLENYSNNYATFSLRKEDRKTSLCYMNIRTLESELPRNLMIEIQIEKEIFHHNSEAVRDSHYEMYESGDDMERVVLGKFQYQLSLDEPPAPRIHNLNQTVDVLGNEIKVNKVTEYPTGTEVEIQYPNKGENEVLSAKVELISREGVIWGNPGGIISHGPDKFGRVTYFFEGDYFSDQSLEYLKVTGISFIKKTEKTLTVNLKEQTISPESSEIYLEGVERVNGKAYLDLTTTFPGHMQSVESSYTDSKGNQYHFTSCSYESNEDQKTNTCHFAVIWPEDDIVRLERCSAPFLYLENPIKIKITP